MGNAVVTMKRKHKHDKPRVVLESPQASDTSQTTRVRFADEKSKVTAVRVKPQMADIGQIHPDDENSRIRYQRSRTVGLGSNSDMTTSHTSVKSTSSAPVDGVWEPTVNPTYEPKRYRDRNTNRNWKDYTGFKESDPWGSCYQNRNGLAKVEEI